MVLSPGTEKESHDQYALDFGHKYCPCDAHPAALAEARERANRLLVIQVTNASTTTVPANPIPTPLQLLLRLLLHNF